MKSKLILAGFVLLLFSACQKNSSSETEDVDYSLQAQSQADDQSRFSGEVEAVASDVNASMESSTSFTGKVYNIAGLICDADVTADSANGQRIITITYNGTNCSLTRTRTGVVTITLPPTVRWKNAGATVTVNFQNVKIIRRLDNKSITLNGTETYTNVSGGLLFELATPKTIVHTLASNNMSITFDDGTKRDWQVARKRTFTYDNGVVITTTGNHTEGSNTTIAEWGTTRSNATFTTSLTIPVVVKQSCNFRVTSGEVKIETQLFTSKALLGLDASGNATGCPGLGFYYARISWMGAAGVTHSSLIPY